MHCFDVVCSTFDVNPITLSIQTQTAALLSPAIASASTREGLLAKGSDTRCEIGDGAACEKLAEGNPYILQLQRCESAHAWLQCAESLIAHSLSPYSQPFLFL